MTTTNDNNSTQIRSSENEQSIYDQPGNLYDNLAPDVSTYINTNFMEQRIVNARQAYPSSHMELSSRVEKEMSDGQWMALQQLMKPVQIAQFAWTTTQTRNTQLYGTSIPNILSTVESLMYRTLSMYAFYKLSPCFRIQVNATQFHQGQLICAFDPFSFTQNSLTNDELTIYSATGLPNVKIMASDSEAAELCIPFIHPRSYLTTNSTGVYNNLGYFSVLILNPLMAADGASPQLTVTIWIYAKDAQVHVPINYHEPILESSGILSQLSDSIQPLVNNVKTGIGQATDLIGNVATGNLGQALRKGQGLIDTLGNVFGFDYPARTIQPDKTISPVENLALGKGKSQSQRLAIDAFSAHQLQDDIASESRSAMDLLKICQMPMLYTQFSFSGTSAMDTLLYSTPIHPCISPQYQSTIQNLPGIQRTYLSYVTNAFMYWSGGIIFDIEIIATKFHSGKLLFAYVPNYQTVPPTYIDASTALPNVIIDLQQSSVTSFKIPWTSPTAMKATSYITPRTGSDTDYILGTLVCYVQNTLAYASNVAPSVEVNIYIRAAPDYSLYVPKRPSFNAYVVPPTTPVENVEESSGIGLINDKNVTTTTSAVLSKDQDNSIPRSHFGEDYSLLDLIKRFSFLETQTVAEIPATGNISNPTVFPARLAVFTPDSNNEQESYLAYWARIYCCWTGTVRYKYIAPLPRTTEQSLTIAHIPDYSATFIDNSHSTIDYLYYLNGFGTVRTNLSQDNAIEFEVPYYSKYNMLLTRVKSNDINIYANGFLYVINQSPTSTETVQQDIYIAAGDDFRFIYLRPPSVDFSNQVVFTATLP
uniref:Structural polyprotein n=1 Tax=Picornavirales sp. TaxID=1955153 RepID=A0A6M9Z837_9VIRU|nr:MAG: hypothetical protein 1 [Picornavirales sp.]